jgi:oligoribonuclease NrnB/cAMP/cGMP phosphodiesterase (DHH superfamily)
MDLICYHNNCADGWSAAYIAKLKYPGAQLVALDHGLSEAQVTAIISACAGLDVLMVDFSFRSREQNDMLSQTAKSFRILDHHKTAEEVLDGAEYAVFDMNRSGAGLAWDYLFGKDAPMMWEGEEIGKPFAYQTRPWWVNYVEDRDLWKFALPESKAINAYIMTFEYETQAWDTMTKVDSVSAILNGRAVLLQIEKYVREVVKQSQRGFLNILDKHYTVAVVNVPYLSTSEVGDALSRSVDISLGWFERKDGTIQFSLRSYGDTDVSVVAQHFGGGGHKNSSGFQLRLDKGREVIDTILGRNK